MNGSFVVSSSGSSSYCPTPSDTFGRVTQGSSPRNQRSSVKRNAAENETISTVLRRVPDSTHTMQLHTTRTAALERYKQLVQSARVLPGKGRQSSETTNTGPISCGAHRSNDFDDAALPARHSITPALQEAKVVTDEVGAGSDDNTKRGISEPRECSTVPIPVAPVDILPGGSATPVSVPQSKRTELEDQGSLQLYELPVENCEPRATNNPHRDDILPNYDPVTLRRHSQTMGSGAIQDNNAHAAPSSRRQRPSAHHDDPVLDVEGGAVEEDSVAGADATVNSGDALHLTCGSKSAFWVRPITALYEMTASIAAKRKTSNIVNHWEAPSSARRSSGSASGAPGSARRITSGEGDPRRAETPRTPRASQHSVNGPEVPTSARRLGANSSRRLIRQESTDSHGSALDLGASTTEKPRDPRVSQRQDQSFLQHCSRVSARRHAASPTPDTKRSGTTDRFTTQLSNCSIPTTGCASSRRRDTTSKVIRCSSGTSTMPGRSAQQPPMSSVRKEGSASVASANEASRKAPSSARRLGTSPGITTPTAPNESAHRIDTFEDSSRATVVADVAGKKRKMDTDNGAQAHEECCITVFGDAAPSCSANVTEPEATAPDTFSHLSVGRSTKSRRRENDHLASPSRDEDEPAVKVPPLSESGMRKSYLSRQGGLGSHPPNVPIGAATKATPAGTITAMLQGIVTQTRRVLPCFLCAEMQSLSNYRIHLEMCREKTTNLLHEYHKKPLPAADRAMEPTLSIPSYTHTEEEREAFAQQCYVCAMAHLVPCRKCGTEFRVHDVKEHELLCGRPHYSSCKAAHRMKTTVERIKEGVQDK